MQIRLNDLDINSGDYLLEEMQFEDAPPISISALDFASEDGAKFIRSRFNSKTITLTGRIIGDNQADLESNLDTFRQTVTEPNIKLNYSYGSGFRQYIGNVSSLAITRKHYQVNYAIYTISFEAGDPPFSQEISAIDSTDPVTYEAFSADNITGNSYSHTLTFDGTARPLPRWEYICDTISGESSKLVFKSMTTGKQLEINEELLSGDVITIDHNTMEVMRNYQEQDYEGIFPEFEVGANEFEFQIYGTNYGAILDQSNNTQQYKGFTIYGYGQTFTPTLNNVYKISLYMLRTGSGASTNSKIILYDTDFASVLGTSNDVYLGDLPLNQWTWVDFYVDGNVVAGNKYLFILTGISGGDYVTFWGTSDDAYSGGGMAIYWAGNWEELTDFDMTFRVYGTGGADRLNHESSIKIDYNKRYI